MMIELKKFFCDISSYIWIESELKEKSIGVPLEVHILVDHILTLNNNKSINDKQRKQCDVRLMLEIEK